MKRQVSLISKISYKGDYNDSLIYFSRNTFGYSCFKVLLENGWNSKQMITEGEGCYSTGDDSARLP